MTEPSLNNNVIVLCFDILAGAVTTQRRLIAGL